MNTLIVLPAITSILALLFVVALLDQWRERRHGFQLIWAAGMLFYGIASGCEAIGTIFKAGVWTGMIAVVVAITLVAFLVMKVSRS